MAASERIAQLIVESNSDAHGYVLAKVTGIAEDGSIFVRLDRSGAAPMRASMLKHVCASAAELLDREVLVGFIGSDEQRPVVLGILENTVPLQGASPAPQAGQQPQTLVLGAEQRIELKCGDASIVIREDGAIIVKGRKIVSRASELQKIEGSTVRIN